MKIILGIMLIAVLNILINSGCRDIHTELTGTTIEGDFGFSTVGGKNGEIVKVTNLKKDGEGSLAAAIQKKGSRIVVFEVAGVIDLQETVLSISNPYITIAGQTAPDPGITLIKGVFQYVPTKLLFSTLVLGPEKRNIGRKTAGKLMELIQHKVPGMLLLTTVRLLGQPTRIFHHRGHGLKGKTWRNGEKTRRIKL